MDTLKLSIIALLLFLVVAETSAQTAPRRGRRPVVSKPANVSAVSQPQPTPAADVPATPRAAVPLATVNGQSITSADIDPKVRQEVEALDERLAEARRQVLDLQINTMLLENEAAKRRMTPQQLYELEIGGKITDPAAAEIDKFIQDNRDQIDQGDPAATRQQVVAYLRADRESRLTDDFIKRLRVGYPVVNLAKADATNLAPATVVATVGGRPVTAAAIDERLKPINYKLRLNTYELAVQALDVTINDLLLLAEANRRNVPPEDIVRKEITEKVHTPNEAEIARFYSENKARIPSELSEVSSQIASYLQEQDRQRLEKELSTRLRAGANIRVLISEPPLPIQSISVDDDPFRGDVNAPVTIVEFTDFQCPSCAAMLPILEEVLKSYGSKVRLVVRDFPLTMHANARKAAEAANAANAQGKFFEYTALLFKRQNALDVPSLKKYASELGLDRARFDAALDGGKYAAEVKHDMEDGEIYGVDSTPAIFVNGIALREMSSDALRALIDRGLAAAGAAPKVSTK
ncbi:MAG TPA: thioredoxin domain-containing protein [Pyrinomonadaceae bacterium]|jgi:protein-disulfide isomerase|nr:thioredoxin domain-containing protein [Pyrinomonadaceae bacterium]